ncbi:MAG: hypothetical protein HND48_02255 [Chloroflexi bacterium]|nr:hypothetical protein [Chloroflexota bacterium]
MDGYDALVALVERKLPLTALSAEARIPRQIDSIPTDVYEVGQAQALQACCHRRHAFARRFRPASASGISPSPPVRWARSSRIGSPARSCC